MKTAKKVSISIQPDLLAAIERRAKRLYGGNISAVIAELGEDVRRLEALDVYVEKYRLAPLSESARVRVDAELSGTEVRKPARSRRAAV